MLSSIGEGLLSCWYVASLIRWPRVPRNTCLYVDNGRIAGVYPNRLVIRSDFGPERVQSRRPTWVWPWLCLGKWKHSIMDDTEITAERIHKDVGKVVTNRKARLQLKMFLLKKFGLLKWKSGKQNRNKKAERNQVKLNYDIPMRNLGLIIEYTF